MPGQPHDTVRAGIDQIDDSETNEMKRRANRLPHLRKIAEDIATDWIAAYQKYVKLANHFALTLTPASDSSVGQQVLQSLCYDRTSSPAADIGRRFAIIRPGSDDALATRAAVAEMHLSGSSRNAVLLSEARPRRECELPTSSRLINTA
jgi:hypothetical protein